MLFQRWQLCFHTFLTPLRLLSWLAPSSIGHLSCYNPIFCYQWDIRPFIKKLREVCRVPLRPSTSLKSTTSLVSYEDRSSVWRGNCACALCFDHGSRRTGPKSYRLQVRREGGRKTWIPVTDKMKMAVLLLELQVWSWSDAPAGGCVNICLYLIAFPLFLFVSTLQIYFWWHFIYGFLHFLKVTRKTRKLKYWQL